MRVLAIDTALGACSACILEDPRGEPLAVETVAMERGHAEALIPLIDRVVSAVEGGFSALDRVAVTVGPGSFTGLRVGISAARAIALAAGIPAVGVTTLSAYAAPAIAGPASVAAAIDARHGQVYLQVFVSGGRTVVTPRIVPAKEAVRLLGSGPLHLVGSGAAVLQAEARAIGLDLQVDPSPAPDIRWVARLGMAATPGQALPKPFYLRPPDARPQDHFRIPRRQA